MSSEDGLLVLIQAIFFVEDQKSFSGIKRKISFEEKEVRRMRSMLKRQNASPPVKRYTNKKIKPRKLYRFFNEVHVPVDPLY